MESGRVHWGRVCNRLRDLRDFMHSRPKDLKELYEAQALRPAAMLSGEIFTGDPLNLVLRYLTFSEVIRLQQSGETIQASLKYVHKTRDSHEGSHHLCLPSALPHLLLPSAQGRTPELEWACE